VYAVSKAVIKQSNFLVLAIDERFDVFPVLANRSVQIEDHTKTRLSPHVSRQ
jgi:hypothetical protein